MKKIKKIYALYKGDNYITDGTIEELAEYLKVKPRTIRYYTTPAYKKRMNLENAINVVCIGKDEQ